MSAREGTTINSGKGSKGSLLMAKKSNNVKSQRWNQNFRPPPPQIPETGDEGKLFTIEVNSATELEKKPLQVKSSLPVSAVGARDARNMNQKQQLTSAQKSKSRLQNSSNYRSITKKSSAMSSVNFS